MAKVKDKGKEGKPAASQRTAKKGFKGKKKDKLKRKSGGQYQFGENLSDNKGNHNNYNNNNNGVQYFNQKKKVDKGPNEKTVAGDGHAESEKSSVIKIKGSRKFHKKSEKDSPKSKKFISNKVKRDSNKFNKNGSQLHAHSNRKPKAKKFNKVGDDSFEQETQSEEVKQRIVKFKRKSFQNEPKTNVKMVVKPGGKWYENSADVKNEKDQGKPENLIKEEDRKLTRDEINGIRKTATRLFENDCAAYKNACLRGEDKSDFQWMEKMMKMGTLPDKMAAFVVKIQDSPVHNLHHLQTLISMVKVQSKQQCLSAAETLKDLFLEDLLPPERKLRAFDKRGSALTQGSREDLIKWVFEDRLRMHYSSFIEALKRMSTDNVEKIRAKAVLLIYQLLNSHPQQEEELLQMIVNKLGDPMKKVGSRGLFYLNSLLQNHPRMKMVVIDEVERLLFRNNIAKRAQYYGICFLNSIDLENEHPEVACKLINVYIAFFKGCVKTGDVESRMMSALLTGVNKSYPLAKEFGFKFSENVDTLYKITHLSNFNIGLQTLSILFQLTDVDLSPNEADRYYRTLYRELLRPEVATTSHSLQFLNLVFRSMKSDKNLNRILGFCRRLLQICQNVQPHLVCAILYLISEVSKSRPDILKVGNIPIDMEDNDDALNSEEETGNVKIDKEEINKLLKISNVKVDEMEELEPRIDDAGGVNQHSFSNTNEPTQQISVIDLNSSGIIVDEDDSKDPIIAVKSAYRNTVTDYDPYARNPSFCGAEFSLFHELGTLTKHYHPSVSLFANTLLRKRHIVYEGNPLKDFTTTRFLERFVYRNPKKPKTTPGAPRNYQPIGLRNVPVNSADYLKNGEENIPVEEKFFYRYFKEKSADKLETNDDDLSDAESVGDDEFDELMANYFKSAKGNNSDEEDVFNDELDFAAEVNNKSEKKRNPTIQDESDDDDLSGNESDGGEDFGPDEDADEMIDDDDDLFEEEGDLEVFESNDFESPANPRKRKHKGGDMFAPADQFAEILESNADEGLSGPSTLINRDNADPKQLKWEMDRDRWMKGYKRNSKTRFPNKRSQKKRRK